MHFHKKIEESSANPFNDNLYNTIFNQLYTPLCRYCIKLVHNSDTAEEIVQEQFVYLWENWERLKDIDSHQAYLYKAVKNRSINFIIKSNRTKAVIELDNKEIDFIDTNLPSPHELLDKKDLELILEKAFESLPERCREIFALNRFADLCNQEIAHKLGISIKTVEAQTTIALKRIKKYIGDNWELFTLYILTQIQHF